MIYAKILSREDSPMRGRYEGRLAWKLALCVCLALILFAAGCGEQKPPDTRAADEKAIRDADAQWSKTAAARDVDGTVSYYSDDASLLAPNAPIASDKQSIRAAWAGLLTPDTSLSWQATKVEVGRSGDLAYLIGTYQLTTKDAHGKPVSDTGKFAEVWKKQADGKWKVVADIFNSDIPLVQPRPVAEKKRQAHHQTRKKKHHSRSSEN
jgi:ketosteroid isomerase-like protein